MSFAAQPFFLFLSNTMSSFKEMLAWIVQMQEAWKLLSSTLADPAPAKMAGRSLSTTLLRAIRFVRLLLLPF